MSDWLSPTGSPIAGTLERTTCCCNIIGIGDDGEPEYSGESEMFWDETHPMQRDGKDLFLDENGEEWTFDQLVKAEERADA